MDKIGIIISKRLNQHKLGESARASEIVYQANRILQEKLQCGDDEVRAYRLKDSILYVGTVGSAWSQEVFHQQESLMKEIRKAHGSKSVLKVIIKSLTSS